MLALASVGWSYQRQAIIGLQPFWNQSDKDADCTLSNNSRTAALAATGGVRSVMSVTTGKWYVLATLDSGGNNDNARYGVATSSHSITSSPGSSATSWVKSGTTNKHNNGSAAAYGTAMNNGDVVMLAYDADADKVWVGEAGTWYSSGDPAAGTNEMYSSVTGSTFLLFGSASSTRQLTLLPLTDANYTTYPPPAGFTAGWGQQGVDLVRPFWSLTDKDADVAITNNDLTATASAQGTVRSHVGYTTGKKYVETVVDSGGGNDNWRFGVTTSTATLTNPLANSTDGWAIVGDGDKITNSSQSAHSSALSNTDVVGLAIDIAAGKVWFSVNGTFVGDPAAGTGEAFSGLTGTIHLAFSGQASPRATTLKLPGSHTYPAPSGFIAGW
jgi:hypothetical protein